MGVPQKIWAVPGYAHASFSPKFFMGFIRTVSVLAKFEVRNFTRSWDNSDWTFCRSTVRPYVLESDRRTDRQTDGQTDGFTIANTALSISSYADAL